MAGSDEIAQTAGLVVVLVHADQALATFLSFALAALVILDRVELRHVGQRFTVGMVSGVVLLNLVFREHLVHLIQREQVLQRQMAGPDKARQRPAHQVRDDLGG